MVQTGTSSGKSGDAAVRTAATAAGSSGDVLAQTGTAKLTSGSISLVSGTPKTRKAEHLRCVLALAKDLLVEMLSSSLVVAKLAVLLSSKRAPTAPGGRSAMAVPLF